MWASDDRLGTFIAGHPSAPPLAEDIYKLRLLDQEDEQSAEDQQQSGEVTLTLTMLYLGDCLKVICLQQMSGSHLPIPSMHLSMSSMPSV